VKLRGDRELTGILHVRLSFITPRVHTPRMLRPRTY
jgi:hypothetical protein